MPPDPLEALRFETPEWLANRPDLTHLQLQLKAALDRAAHERDRLSDRKERLRSDWQDFLINWGGSGFATAGLLKMMAATTLVFSDLMLGGVGSLLTLWGGNRFWNKVEAESEVGRQIAALTERLEHLEQSLSQVSKARKLREATTRSSGRF